MEFWSIKVRYYKVGSSRQEVRDTKTEDESFYLLTLAAVAKELKRRGLWEAKSILGGRASVNKIW